tara:strand:- start:20 stop:394 length:375 start_codon:yes stop_codon:yes gene_type:complete
LCKFIKPEEKKGREKMSKEKSYELDDLVIDACQELDDIIEGEELDIIVDDLSETIHEIADNSVPIYFWDIGQYASHNSWLMTEIPDIINSEGNAHDQIQANIYQYVVDGLYEHLAEKEKEKDDE